MKLAELRSLTALALSGTLRNSSPRLTSLYRQASTDWLDDAFFQILRKLDVSGFLECGAHEASASVRFIHEGGETAVAAEANPATFNTMTTPARIHNVTCLNIGVGEEDGVLEFNVPRSNHVAGSASFMKKPGIAYSTANVPVHTIAHLHAEYFGPHQSIGLWVDVEGMALPVLKGA